MNRLLFPLALMLMSVSVPHALAQTCAVATTGLVFGNYQPLTGTSTTSTATVTVTCNPGLIALNISYTVALGTGASGSFAARTMSSTGGHLNYQLYKDPAYSVVFGDGTAGTSTLADGYLLGLLVPVVRSYTVYARIPASQAAGVGSYLDSVMVMLTY